VALDFDMGTLVERVRNLGSDRPQMQRDALVSLGGPEITLRRRGFITLDTVTVDGTDVPVNTCTLQLNVLILPDDPGEDADVVVVYSVARYTDAEVKSFLCDAAIDVSDDVGVSWDINRTTAHLNIEDDRALTEDGLEMTVDLQRLLSLKAAVRLRSDRANSTADSAIMVKDGDTTIDTSKASGSAEGVVGRLAREYSAALKSTKHRRFSGVSHSE
jgi:hypothetical protein